MFQVVSISTVCEVAWCWEIVLGSCCLCGSAGERGLRKGSQQLPTRSSPISGSSRSTRTECLHLLQVNTAARFM